MRTLLLTAMVLTVTCDCAAQPDTPPPSESFKTAKVEGLRARVEELRIGEELALFDLKIGMGQSPGSRIQADHLNLENGVRLPLSLAKPGTLYVSDRGVPIQIAGSQETGYKYVHLWPNLVGYFANSSGQKLAVVITRSPEDFREASEHLSLADLVRGQECKEVIGVKNELSLKHYPEINVSKFALGLLWSQLKSDMTLTFIAYGHGREHSQVGQSTVYDAVRTLAINRSMPLEVH